MTLEAYAQLDVKKADPELVCQSCGHRTSQLDAFARIVAGRRGTQ